MAQLTHQPAGTNQPEQFEIQVAAGERVWVHVETPLGRFQVEIEMGQELVGVAGVTFFESDGAKSVRTGANPTDPHMHYIIATNYKR